MNKVTNGFSKLLRKGSGVFALFTFTSFSSMLFSSAPFSSVLLRVLKRTSIVCVYAIIAFVVTTTFPASLFAAIDLELTQGVDSARVIAVLPFLGEEVISNNANNVRSVIAKDLQNSGRFKLADVTGLLPALNGGDVDSYDKSGSKGSNKSNNRGGNSGGANINYDFWRGRKVEDVITGNVQKLGGGGAASMYSVAFQLNDVYSKVTLLGRDFNKTPEVALRALAHHISDLIYEKLTGERGIFATQIVYVVVQRDVGAQTAKYSLEVADVDGYNPRILLTSDQPIMSPAWSPDGKKIAYVSFEGNRANVYVQDVASGQRQVVSKQPGMNSAPAWSPDGKKLALVLSITGYPKIYVLDIGSGSLEQLTADWYLDTEPGWAKDGQSIIFTSNRGGSPQIYRVYLGSKKVERVSYQGSYNARASFTADGKNVVMLHQDGGGFNIAMQNLETGRVSVLTRGDFNESPSLAPNGKMIVYATNANGRGVLAIVSSDGKVKMLLPARDGEVQEPAWSPFMD